MAVLKLVADENPHKVGAAFPEREDASKARDALVRNSSIDRSRISLVDPESGQGERLVEPEPATVHRTLVRSHVWLGSIGLVLGLALAAILLSIDFPLVASSPVLGVSVLGFFGAIGGLLIGGFIALRPDHDSLIDRTREASDEGEWMVVVHAENSDEKQQAKQVLNKMGEDVRQSL